MEYKAENPFDAPDSSGSTDPRVRELMKKEEELNQRERNLEQRQQAVKEAAASLPRDPRANNWPICRPFLYHDINADMPTPQIARMMRIAYLAWIFSVVCLFWNWVVLLANLFAVSQSGSSIGDMILAIVYFFILFPTWFLIYRVLYRAGRKQKPSLFILWFCLYTLQLIGYGGMAVGYPGTGCAGFWLMIIGFRTNKVVGILLLVSSIMWCVAFAVGVFIWILARVQYSAAGGNNKAKYEFGSAAATTAANNPEIVVKGAQFAATTV